MKSLMILLFVLLVSQISYAKDKQVIYDKDTQEIIAIKISERPAKQKGRVNIVCEDGTIFYGANPEKVIVVSIDEKTIPEDLASSPERSYKIDVNKKEISKKAISVEVDK